MLEDGRLSTAGAVGDPPPYCQPPGALVARGNMAPTGQDLRRVASPAAASLADRMVLPSPLVTWAPGGGAEAPRGPPTAVGRSGGESIPGPSRFSGQRWRNRRLHSHRHRHPAWAPGGHDEAAWNLAGTEATWDRPINTGEAMSSNRAYTAVPGNRESTADVILVGGECDHRLQGPWPLHPNLVITGGVLGQ